MPSSTPSPRPSARITFILLVACACLVSPLVLGGCAQSRPTVVRDTDAPWLDEPAMSTGLDRRDLERLLDENLASMASSAWWNGTYDRPAVAVMPLENHTSEHVSNELQALMGMVETQLVQSGQFTVIAANLRDEIIAELQLQQGAAFDASRALPLGRQRGVHYFVTGRVYDSSERTADMRRVQYTMFMQVVSVETGAIEWQHQADLTKGIVPL